MMKLLLPVDGSQNAQATLDWVTSFFDKAQVTLYLLHVVDLVPDLPRTEYELDRAQTILNEARQCLEAKGFQVAESQYIIEQPSRAICRYAEEEGMDQIIMGSHGRQGLEKFLIGSVSEEVFRCASRPVLIYKNVGPSPSLEVSDAEAVHPAG
jgi:nucleotide-binding universal stress UspA family protein